MSLRPPRPGQPGFKDWLDLADAVDQAGILGAGAPAIMPGMPMTSKEKQEAFRARNAMLGLTEVRGVFLPPDKHAELKAFAAKLLAQTQKSAPNSP